MRSPPPGVLEFMHATPSPALPSEASCSRPLVVGHRGAPAYRPEHTRESFELAIDLGADLIEPDVLVSRDGALVVRHESALSLTTDVAYRPEFAGRRRAGLLEGRPVRDWFIEDFDLDELRTLRAMERMPGLRPLNTAYDGRSGLLTLAEVIGLAHARSTPERKIGVFAELKAELAGPGAELAALVAAELRRPDPATAQTPVMLASFEAPVLRRLRQDLGDDGPPLVQLVDDCPSFDVMTTPVGLREVSTYAQAIGPGRDRILLRDEDDAVARTTDLVDRAHDAALAVHVWTLLPENVFLPRQFRTGLDPLAHGDAAAEARVLLDLGVDGLITDAPETGVRARNRAVALV